MGNSLTNIKVLFVDDEEDICTNSVFRLKEEGYDVSFANNGQDAVDIVRSNHIDILIIDYFMTGITGEETIRQIRSFNKQIIIILQTAYSGQKPGVEMLDILDIQGYYDKAEDFEKLLCWVKVGVRVCLQMKQMKKLFESVQLANKTIEEVQKDQNLLLEQTRLAAIGELTGVVSENILVPLGTAEVFLEGHIKMKVDKLKDLIELNDWTRNTRFECKGILNQLTDLIGKTAKILGDTKQCTLALWNQMDKNDNVSQSRIFSMVEVMNVFEALVREAIADYKFEIKSIVYPENKDMILFDGKIVNLVQVLLKVTTIIVKTYKSIVGKSVVSNNFLTLEIQEKPDEQEAWFVFTYNGENTIDELLREVVFTKHVDDLGIGLYTVYSIVIEQFNGRIWSEQVENNQATKTYVAIPTILPHQIENSDELELKS